MSQCVRVAAVIITLPQYAAFNPASIHDVEVRIGRDMPDDSIDPATSNVRCALTTGPLGLTDGASQSGTVVRVACTNRPLEGKIVTIQIR